MKFLVRFLLFGVVVVSRVGWWIGIVCWVSYGCCVLMLGVNMNFIFVMKCVVCVSILFWC